MIQLQLPLISIPLSQFTILPGNSFVLRGPGRVQIDGRVEHVGERAATVALLPVSPVNGRIAAGFHAVARPVNQRVHPRIQTTQSNQPLSINNRAAKETDSKKAKLT